MCTHRVVRLYKQGWPRHSKKTLKNLKASNCEISNLDNEALSRKTLSMHAELSYALSTLVWTEAVYEHTLEGTYKYLYL